MKKIYLLRFLFTVLVLTVFSCSEEDDYVQVSPVVLDVSQVPYPKLSDYNFFEGDMKDQNPAYKVLPYKPASELFSDYAQKKRFVWMPSGVKATWNGADNVMEFPIGAVLIKTFYYNDVTSFNGVNQPSGTTKLIETRLLIKHRNATPTNSGWETYDYIWNEEQTEAFRDTQGDGIFIPITWNQSGVVKTIDYKIPAYTECNTCHKLNPNHTSDGEIVIPIGVKPQNLNNTYNYGGSSQNQLQRWISEGYLESGIPTVISSTVDYKDTSKSLELRARSYIDINCAHCHRDGGHCDYVNMKFNFSNTNMEDFGVCMVPLFNVENLPFVITAGDADNSEIIYRIGSSDGSVMMPILGRTIIHEEGVALMREWINSLPQHCE